MGANGKELEKWNFSFSKGIRRCLGLPSVFILALQSQECNNESLFEVLIKLFRLANLEMAACLAYFFARFDMDLYDTDASSMEWVDQGTAGNKKDVEVMIIRDRWA